MSRRIGRRAALAALVGVVGLVPGVFADDEYAIEDVDVEQDDGPLSLSVALSDADAGFDSPATLELSVTNDGDDPLELRNRGVLPFGVLEAVSTDAPRPPAVLDSPAYAESEYVDAGPQNVGLDRTELTTTIAPGETLSETYELDGADVREPGTYEIEGWEPVVAAREVGADEFEAVPLTITLEIRTRDVLPW